MDSIESTIIRGLLYSPEYTQRVYPYLTTEFFSGETKLEFQIFSELYDKYNKIPTMEMMLLAVQDKPLNEDTYSEVVASLEYVYKNRKTPINVDWLVDETEHYCVDRATYNAVYDSINILEGNDKHRDKHAIPEILDKALSISFDQDVGMSYFDSVEARYAHYTSDDSKLAMPLRSLNQLMNGGIPSKTLNILLAGTNVGKSALMCYLAGELLKAGKNVLYFSAEMGEIPIQHRIDANLLNVTTDELLSKDLDKDWFVGKVNKLRKQTVGDLIVKEYPTSSAHAGHIRHFLKEIKQKKGFVPDIIFLDYINIFTSSRYKSLSGVNSYSYIKAIAEEMRGLAVEFDVPIMSATQLNREGASSMSPDMTATSESFGLPATADWMAAIVTSDELMEMNQQMACLLKTRYGNKQGATKQMLGVDFDRMRYYDVGGDDEVKETVGKVTPKTKEIEKNKLEGWEM